MQIASPLLVKSLKKESAVLLKFNTTATLDELLAKRIIESFSTHKQPGNVSVETASIEGDSHTFYLWANRKKKDSAIFDFVFSCDLDSLKDIEKYPKVTELLTLLSEGKNQNEFDCQIKFMLKRNKKLKTIINLPLVISNSRLSALNELRGVHVATLSDDGSEINIILDTLPAHGLHVNLDFTYSGVFEPQIFDRVLNLGLGILNKYVSKE
jgi:hypothetical protein